MSSAKKPVAEAHVPRTFDDDDRLNRKEFCERLENFLLIENDYVDGSLVVALDGGFGTGKTTFVEMWKTRLISRREKGEFVPMPVVLNAWESDHCGDPMVAILAGLIEAAENWKGKDAPDKNALVEASKSVGWFAVGIANELSSKWAGVDAAKVGEFAAKKMELREAKVPDFIKMYQQRVDALRELKARLHDAFGGDPPKVIVFIDELDRCRPDYAVGYLETIKHVFDVEGMMFVLTVDLPHLEGSAKALFGNSLKFNEYFRKFCHRIFELPPPGERGYAALVNDYVGRYVSVEGKRATMLGGHGSRERAVEIIIALKLTPRQIQESFRIIGHTLQSLDARTQGQLLWALGIATILLSCIRVSDPELFKQVQIGDDGIEPLCRKLLQAMGKEDAVWWVQIVLSGSWNRERSSQFGFGILRELGFLGEEDSDTTAFMRGFAEGWGHGSDRLRQVAGMIEEIKSFGR